MLKSENHEIMISGEKNKLLITIRPTQFSTAYQLIIMKLYLHVREVPLVKLFLIKLVS